MGSILRWYKQISLSDNLRAGCYMMLSMLGFTVNDLLVKSLDGSLPLGQVMLMRGSILSLLIFFILWQKGLLRRVREVFIKTVALRSLADAFATILFLLALWQLPFANISAILQVLPLAVTMGAALFLSEPVGWRRWTAILIGFSGVLLIIRPGMAGFDAASLLVLGSVVLAAVRDLATRCLPAAIPSLLVTAATIVVVTLTGLIFSLVQAQWQPVKPFDLLILICAACSLFFGLQFIVLAMRSGEIAYVAPFRYTGLLWAIVLAYLLFGEQPGLLTLLGSVIVVGSGLFSLYREIVTTRPSP